MTTETHQLAEETTYAVDASAVKQGTSRTPQEPAEAAAAAAVEINLRHLSFILEFITSRLQIPDYTHLAHSLSLSLSLTNSLAIRDLSFKVTSAMTVRTVITMILIVISVMMVCCTLGYADNDNNVANIWCVSFR